MNVYLVCIGQYSDFRVLCVCSTAEKADEAEAYYAADEVIEFELDAFPENNSGLLMFSVCMDRNGDNARVGRYGNDRGEDLGTFYRPTGDFYCTLLARDEQHAIKIANERRIMLLAAGKEKGP